MTETKWDVFNDLLEELADAYITLEGEGIGDELTNEDKQAYLKDYDNALPDDLPVIPEAVGEYIKDNKDLDLLVALTIASNGYKHSELWIAMYQDTFARAWVLGVWRVEETGEIVKLEEKNEIL